MTLPPALTTTEATAGRVLGAVYAPPLKALNRKMTAHRSSLLPCLSVATASSLRPARVKSITAAAAAAATAPTMVTAVASVSRLADAATTHPLLSQLLRASVPAASVELPQQPEEVTVAEAVEALGGSDVVEELLSQLNGVAHSADANDDGAFANAIETCVQQTLGASEVSVDAIEGHEIAVTGEEGGESGTRASPLVNVTIPLTVSDFHAATFTSLAAHQRRSRLSNPTAASAPRRNYSSCLVLRVQRCRGVLALRIVNVRYEGTSGTSHSTLRGVASDTEDQKKKRRVREKNQRQRCTAPRQHRQPASRKERGSTTGVDVVASCAPPAPSDAEDIVAGTVVGEVESFSIGSADTRPWSSAVALVDGRSLRASAASPTHSQRTPKGAGSLRQGSRTTAAVHHAATKSRADAVLFDPCCPETTTPFNAQHRPVTYNATIAFQAPL
ncbi:hypothetical protein, unknown function [Leishmania mexicana MHOM/GT/2001/U1103]|uniref:Uncharacterized protein n=1 Tax=Leishmania mexicana (strain MHOM/GT/2001/U1103) TaxID=929439 RepID=E9ALL6_LEIMU|nr:hypothetical protein, unknown function [Leishmania mexicana MHOM/GT/2001/U1103]CBZ23821.1 hypothetical protein, unknown function [Leishmania mexicana MHOM/GT/2001/U1103]